MINPLNSSRFTGKLLRLGTLLLAVGTAHASDWWDAQWSLRKPLVVDASPTGVALDTATGTVPLLVRLHDGNFQFAAAAANGQDVRVLAADGKTELPLQIESYDGLLNEAFAWIRLADVKPGTKTDLTFYYGNPAAAAAAAAAASPVYDDATLLVYHFTGNGNPVDSSGKNHNASNTAAAAPASMIGSGLRLGGAPVVIPAPASLQRAAGSPLTWSAWMKPASLDQRAIVFHWGDTRTYLQLGLDAAIPYFEIKTEAKPSRVTSSMPLPANAWVHLALVADSNSIKLYINGQETAAAALTLPALTTEALLGAGPDAGYAYSGEFDELSISGTARSAGWVKFAAISQSGSTDSQKLVAMGAEESAGGGHNATLEHVMLFGDIAKNMMFDGWIAVGICCIMMAIAWVVALQKFAYLGRIEKGSEEFLRRWQEVSTDLTVIDHSDSENVKSLGGSVQDARQQALMQQSPLYHLYHIGSEEIRHRINSKRGFNGLSVRSITAIKASLDAGMTRETHRLNSGLISLTIGIAGGPYVGLMGTVVGVMITFAVIAKTGEVEVNSIAPGIASALLATVFGLLVAIPALFLYSFLNSRIKNSVSDMQLFIDEFITKMAEFYPVNEGKSSRKQTDNDEDMQEAVKR